jgi:hypothetical protein
VAQWASSLDLTAHTSLSPIQHGFVPGFVNYKIGCTRLTAGSDKVYQYYDNSQWSKIKKNVIILGKYLNALWTKGKYYIYSLIYIILNLFPSAYLLFHWKQINKLRYWFSNIELQIMNFDSWISNDPSGLS